MIWTTSVIDKLIDSGAPIEQQAAINSKLALLVRLCGEHVPYAPAPLVEWNDNDQSLHLAWFWKKQNRTYTLRAGANGALESLLLAREVWVEKANPTDEEITQHVLTFFEGYSP